MSKARLDGLTLLLMGSFLFVAIGFLMEITNRLGTTDFQELYYGARTIAHQGDPYQPAQVEATAV